MRASKRFVLREVAGERTLLPLDQDGFGRLVTYGLSEEGALLWRMLEAGATAEELKSAYREFPGADDPSDVDDFLEFLDARGALVRSEGE